MSDKAETPSDRVVIVPGRNEYAEEEHILAIERDISWQEDKRRIREKWER